MSENNISLTVLVLGATGYIGGRLVPMLLDKGFKVRAAARSARKLTCREWAQNPNLEIVAADVQDKASLRAAMEGVDTAFYLVHSMTPGTKDFAKADRTGALNMAQAAAEAGIRRIIYLGGLAGGQGEALSHHLQSRIEVGRILSEGQVPVTWLRAAMILGSGSASFEIMRYLVERLPVMLTPRWVRSKCQPIAVSDVLAYLLGCLENPETMGQEFDIGGPDILSYEEMFQLYAREAGLTPRLIIPVPVLTPRLSSWWIHLVTPLPASIARPLAQGLRNTVICKENRIQAYVPLEPLTCRQAIRRALSSTCRCDVITCWTDAGGLTPPEWVQCGDAPYAGGAVLDCNYATVLRCTPARAWNVISRIGGETGWYYADFLWRLRGLLDRLLGGPGLRRGRRHPSELHVGDALDFWRVLAVEEYKRLLLQAEMKLPGEAVMQFSIEPLAVDRIELRLITRFRPRGLFGLLYWHTMKPGHALLFKGMLAGMSLRIGCTVLSPPRAFSSTNEMCRLPPE